MSAHAQNPKGPDFAFPQTVAKNADVALKNAVRTNDAPQAIEALLQIMVANQLIEGQTTANSIKTIEETTAKFIDSQMVSLFYALQAEAYRDYLNQDYRMSAREIPIDAVSDDISEWSEAQFDVRIKELAELSIAHANPLADMPLLDYTNIITSDSLSRVYYPTLLDFVCSNALRLYGDIDDTETQKTEAIDLALSHCAELSAPYIIWTRALVENTNSTSEAMRTAYLDNLANPYAGLLLEDYYGQSDVDDEIAVYVEDAPETDDKSQAKRTWVYQQIESILRANPECPVKANLLTIKQQLSQKRAQATFPALCGIGQKFDVNIKYANTNRLSLNIYSVKGRDTSNKLLQGLKPVRTIDVELPGTVPFNGDTVVSVMIDKPGYYVIIPEANGLEFDNYSFSRIHCVGAYPIAFNYCQRVLVAIVDPVTGAPLSGAKVEAVNPRNKTISYSSVTDEQGIVDMTKGCNGQRGPYIAVTYRDKRYVFEDVTLFTNTDTRTNDGKSLSISTDRSLYHMGEKVNFLVVASQSTSTPDGKWSGELSADTELVVSFTDANYQQIAEVEGVTDAFGRFTGEFQTPTDGLTGSFTIKARIKNGYYGYSSARVTVSDYKLPDFELQHPIVARDVPDKGDVTISGTAMTYSGVPLQGATITATVSTASWWRWFSPQRQVFSVDATTDADGKYSVVVPDSVFAENPHDKFYMAVLDGVSPTGTNAQVTATFSLGKQYMISIDHPQANIDGTKPFTPAVTVTAPDGTAVDIPLLWTLTQKDKLVDMGQLPAEINLSGVTPGTYTFTVKAADSALANDASVDITIYNRTTDIVPGDEPLWIEKSQLTIEGNRVSIPYGTIGIETYVYYTLSDFTNLRQCNAVKVGKGYHDLTIDLPADYQFGVVNLYTVRDGNLCRRTINLSRPPRKPLTIEGETFRDKLIPGSAETWRIRISQDGNAVQSALVLDMYNKALEALEPHNLTIGLPRQWMQSNLSIDMPNNYRQANSSTQYLTPITVPNIIAPTFVDYGYSGRRYFGRGPVLYKAALNMVTADMVVEECCYDSAPQMASGAMVTGFGKIDAEDVEDESDDNGTVEQPTAPDTFDYRDAEVPLAIWAPSLTTDSLGIVTYEFTVPNANTTWRLRAVAWAQDLNVGTLMRDFVAQKPIMVQPNAPRFMRVGDNSAITCLIINNADTAVVATTTVEMFDPMTDRVITSQTFTSELAANGQATVEAPFSAPSDMSAIGYRVRTSNGKFADGERAVLPVLPSEAQVIETTPFYLNPGDTTFSMTLPADLGARLSLTFTENPAWTIVSALPGLRQMRDNCANSAAAALFSAAIGRGILHDNPEMSRAIKMWQENPNDSALISMLERNEDLKIAVLNATPWVQAAQSDTERMANLALIFDDKQTSDAIASAIKTLDKLQNADGGWKWGDWCRESSVWVTANVLEMLGDLRTYGWLPNDNRLKSMISKAVRYYDSHVYDKKYPEQPDMLYCLLRPRFNDIPVSADGQKVIRATLKYINKEWRKMDNPTTKAEAAEILFLNNNAALAGTLMASLNEFGVWTPTQGLTYPAVNSLASYGIILEAYAMILSGSRQVDGLRQQLIVRKEATDWGSAVVTSQVVASILSSGSKWTVDAKGAHITVGDTTVQPSSPIESATGALRADLSPYGGERLTIETTGAGPAYGAVYAQFQRQIDNVEASSCDDLSITKQMWVRRGTEWAVIDSLTVGDRVRVQLTIHAKRNMQYVIVHDDRPAAFEPVDQLPAWIWADGATFYRENRDTFTGLYIEYLRPGTYLLTYDMNVSHPGTFLSGVATIQSQYAPSLSAHSDGAKLIVK